jgi:hypothetical protein
MISILISMYHLFFIYTELIKNAEILYNLFSSIKLNFAKYLTIFYEMFIILEVHKIDNKLTNSSLDYYFFLLDMIMFI